MNSPSKRAIEWKKKIITDYRVRGHQRLLKSLSSSGLAAGRTPQGSIAGRLNYSCDLPSAFTTGYIWRQDVGPDGQWVRPAKAALMRREAELKKPRNAEQAVDNQSPCRSNFKTYRASRPDPIAACTHSDGRSPSETICLPLISPTEKKTVARSGPKFAFFATPSEERSTPLNCYGNFSSHFLLNRFALFEKRVSVILTAMYM